VAAAAAGVRCDVRRGIDSASALEGRGAESNAGEAVGRDDEAAGAEAFSYES